MLAGDDGVNDELDQKEQEHLKEVKEVKPLEVKQLKQPKQPKKIEPESETETDLSDDESEAERVKPIRKPRKPKRSMVEMLRAKVIRAKATVKANDVIKRSLLTNPIPIPSLTTKPVSKVDKNAETFAAFMKGIKGAF